MMAQDRCRALVNVIIPNWNSGKLLRDCLAAIVEARPLSLIRVVIVDNASTDGSAAVDNFASKLPLTIISNTENHGFAFAANQGAACCSDGDFLFLNPDVTVGTNAIDAAANALADEKSSPRVGIVGIRMTDSDGVAQPATSRFPTPWRLLAQACGLHLFVPSLARFDAAIDQETTQRVDQVMGAFLMVRRDVFSELSGFDERFFLYFEDVDLCLRARQAGYTCFHVAETKATHVGQGCTRAIEDLRLTYLLRSRLQYADKHFSAAGRLLTRFATLAAEPVVRAAGLLLRGDRHKLRLLARSYVLLLRSSTSGYESTRALGCSRQRDGALRSNGTRSFIR